MNKHRGKSGTIVKVCGDLYSEYRFAPPRRYRWDFAHPASKIGIDIQGGVWMETISRSIGCDNLDV